MDDEAEILLNLAVQVVGETELGVGEVSGQRDELSAGGGGKGVVKSALDEGALDAAGCVGVGAGTGEAVDGLDGRVGSKLGDDVSSERASCAGDGL